MRRLPVVGTRRDSQGLELLWAFDSVGLTKELVAVAAVGKTATAAAKGLTVAVWLMTASKDG